MREGEVRDTPWPLFALSKAFSMHTYEADRD